MKALLLRDKMFLKSLYTSENTANTRNILYFANDSQLNTLILFLHMISNGVIKVKKEHFDALEKRHIKLIRKNFEPKVSLQGILRGDRKVKVQLLQKFASKFHDLLYTLFNLIITKS